MATRRHPIASRHLRWESFEERIYKGPPSVEAVAGSPRVYLFIEAGGRRIGAHFFTNKSITAPSPLAEVDIREIRIGADTALEVSTGNQALYRDFYALCCLIADRVQIEKQAIAVAVTTTLRSFVGTYSQQVSALPRAADWLVRGVVISQTSGALNRMAGGNSFLVRSRFRRTRFRSSFGRCGGEIDYSRAAN